MPHAPHPLPINEPAHPVATGEGDAVAMAASGITAVVVTFNPDTTLLAELLRRTRPQVEHIELIDNGSTEPTLDAIRALCADDQVRLTTLGENRGVAGAQNAGIALARQHGARYVLLLDHDSLPSEGMVARLRTAIEHAPASQQPVGAAGPRFVDERQRESITPFRRLVGVRRVRCQCETDDQLLDVEHVIASGCLIPLAVLNQVGDMDAGLFIDYVDIEWCLRAQHHGFHILGVCAASMVHNLGENPIRIFGRNLPNHSPLRNYYLFRNALLLYRMSHISWQWKCMDARIFIMRIGLYLATMKPRIPRLNMILRGLFDGLRKKTGPFQP
ncbi:MAG: glycosyltransferase family 2 protein [Lautropia sp.]|nr:glycosyltransferase family 2 protein [Lautropia sp.]